MRFFRAGLLKMASRRLMRQHLSRWPRPTVWLKPMEPVIRVQVGEDVRAYPIQILMWHEIVNDTVGGKPLTVTFCPLCNTAIVFERTVSGRRLGFWHHRSVALQQPHHVRPADRDVVATGHGQSHRG